MTLEPVFNASLPIQLHIVTVAPAAVIGAWLLASRKGTPLHRLFGRIWIALMVASAVSSLFIHTIRMVGPFSPIHLLSVYVMIGAWQAVAAARSGRIREHRRATVGMYLGGIVGAGLFTLLPGRLMNEVVFAGQSPGAMASILLVLGLIVWPFFSYLRHRQLARP